MAFPLRSNVNSTPGTIKQITKSVIPDNIAMSSNIEPFVKPINSIIKSPVVNIEPLTPLETISKKRPTKGRTTKQFQSLNKDRIKSLSPQSLVPITKVPEKTKHDLLVDLAPIWHGNLEQVDYLLTLEYPDGKFIIDIQRKDVLNEIIGMLRDGTFDDVVDFLISATSPEYILWEQKSMDAARGKLEKEIAIQQTEEIGIKGVGKCRYCPSKELVFAMRQTRSGDEPLQGTARCVQCQKSWKIQ